MAILDFQAAMGYYQGSARVLVWPTNSLLNKRVLMRFQARDAMFSQNGFEHRISERPWGASVFNSWYCSGFKIDGNGLVLA